MGRQLGSFVQGCQIRQTYADDYQTGNLPVAVAQGLGRTARV